VGSLVGQFVEVRWDVFAAAERAENIPASTRQVPLVARVKGFALQRGELGQDIEVLTLAGRVVRGMLIDTSPHHSHGFGRPQPELLRVGPDLRRELTP